MNNRRSEDFLETSRCKFGVSIFGAQAADAYHVSLSRQYRESDRSNWQK